jgi:hypothetical protein
MRSTADLLSSRDRVLPPLLNWPRRRLGLLDLTAARSTPKVYHAEIIPFNKCVSPLPSLILIPDHVAALLLLFFLYERLSSVSSKKPHSLCGSITQGI